MKIHVEVSDDHYKKLQELKKRENRSIQFLATKAIINFLISKKLLTMR